MKTNIAIDRLPVALFVEFQRYPEQCREYEVTFEVKDAPETRVVALVNKPDDGKAFLARIESDESRLLSQHLQRRLLLLVFRLLYSEMIAADGEAIEWHMNDASCWIRRQFGFVEGQQIISRLIPHVPDVEPFQSWNCVRVG